MVFAGNELYFSGDELEVIRLEAETEGRSLVEEIEALLRDREPDFTDLIIGNYGGFVLYNLDAPEGKRKIGEIGNPKQAAAH